LSPVEVAFVTLTGLSRMPARPGTVELVRSGRVVAGEADVLARLPRWEPTAIAAEERLLLLENRGVELLWADSLVAAGGVRPLARMRARQAVLKTALDLAAVRTLGRGELPPGAEARVARASELGAPEGSPSWLTGAWDALPALWRESIDWRRGGARDGPDRLHADAWRHTVRAWCAAWWCEAGHAAADDPWERALAGPPPRPPAPP